MALASLTAAARAISLGVEWTDARCPSCNWRVMSIPGRITVNVVAVSSDRFRSGLGRCCVCRRCKTLCEVIEE